ncbi:uncharacterized protein [Ptychodera flava]|uniref:uncharacterized protein n=1 Tax=Ptychodera flava TaxID=63121 RepID=UPI00396AA462
MEDRDKFQEDLNNLEVWSKDWQMSFNVDKCKVMHVGSTNPQYNYTMNNIALTPVEEEKDLGVLIHNSMKTSKHCAEAVKKANRALGFIKRNIKYKTKFNIIRLYKSLVRPHIEYAVQFWNPHYIKDITLVEKVQRRATKLIPELCHLSYEERLKELKLTTLEERRMRGDLIQVFRIIKGIDRVSPYNLFTFSQHHRTRGHTLKLAKSRVRLDCRKYFFTQRIVSAWNNYQHILLKLKQYWTSK